MLLFIFTSPRMRSCTCTSSGQGQRVAHLHARLSVVLEVWCLFALLGQFLRCVEGDVGLFLRQQLVYVFLVNLAAFALPVGAVLSAEAHALVEVDAQPSETLDDVFLGPRHEARGVRILDAKHHFAAMLASEEIVVECCAHAADVERPCGARCEAYAYFSFCHILRSFVLLGAKIVIFGVNAIRGGLGFIGFLGQW